MEESSANDLQMIVMLFTFTYLCFYLAYRKFGWRDKFMQYFFPHNQNNHEGRANNVVRPGPGRAVRIRNNNGGGVGMIERPQPRPRSEFVAPVEKPQEPNQQARRPIPARQWIPSLFVSMQRATLPHLLIVGETRGGKTTAARAIISVASETDCQIAIIDPHAEEGDWPFRAIGEGRNFKEIAVAMAELEAEFDRRFASRNYKNLTPIYILIDEWGAIINTPEGKRDCPKAIDFLRKFVCESAKIHMHILVLNQSKNVEDLGISGGIRNNFSKLLIGNYAHQLLPGAFKPIEWYATNSKYATAIEHSIHKWAVGSLDTLRLSQRPVNPACVWYSQSQTQTQPEPQPQPQIVQRFNPMPAPAPVQLPQQPATATGGGANNDNGGSSNKLDQSKVIDQHIMVAAWLVEEPELSAGEVARRLFGKNGGRYTVNAGIILSRVKGVTASVTQDDSEDEGGITQEGVTGVTA